MNSVIKGTSYVLIHTPDMVIHNGTTQTTERVVNPDSEYLRKLPGHIRDYEAAVSYYPNQTYIGNVTPGELEELGPSWVDKRMDSAGRYGPFGEIMPQEEFLLLLQISDTFDVVRLDKTFVAAAAPGLQVHPLFNEKLLSRLCPGVDGAEVVRLVKEEGAEPLYHQGDLVGCVGRAHDIDVNLSAHVMLENLAAKASCVLALLHAVKNAGIDREEVDYVIDCCEEACGDMNQRGGGNFAKAEAEIAGLIRATGSDTRGFCAGPAHAMVNAAALVKAGAYQTVIVAAGGCTAKLGMNGKDHVKKGLPILEDMLGGFAVVIGENDGRNPEINLDILGRHAVGTGSSPQAVLSALVAEPLKRAGLRISDVDKFSVEMQNPDITRPAGAGDVPAANYKMIAALAAVNGEIEKKELMDFVARHGMTGWAPTQGHIPSGVPYLGFARQEILSGKTGRVQVIGKGSLFLGRMTNLFDGISFVIQPNSGKQGEIGGESGQIRQLVAEAFRKLAAELCEEE